MSLIYQQRDNPKADTILPSVLSLPFTLLTLYTHLALTTGLLVRWRTLYSPGAVLIRLLGLQSICWPATHFTLKVLNHAKRPEVCWAIIGTTTTVSRSIQMWVCSNLGVVRVSHGGAMRRREDDVERSWWSDFWDLPHVTLEQRRRRWNWPRVLQKCGVPLGICYFIMAWTQVLWRELG